MLTSTFYIYKNIKNTVTRIVEESRSLYYVTQNFSCWNIPTLTEDFSNTQGGFSNNNYKNCPTKVRLFRQMSYLSTKKSDFSFLHVLRYDVMAHIRQVYSAFLF